MSRKPREWTAKDIAAVKAWEVKQVAAGKCPWSGLLLYSREDGRRSCHICDCPGYAPAEAGPQ